MSSQTVYFNNPADITKLKGQVGTVAGQVNTSIVNTSNLNVNSKPISQVAVLSQQDEEIERIIRSMTLEEKASIMHGVIGDNFSAGPSQFKAFFNQGVERVLLPEIIYSDGPMGLRGAMFNDYNSSFASQLPQSIAQAATFDKNLMYRLGKKMGFDARSVGTSSILSPIINVPRSSLWGREYESLGEDPFLAGLIAIEMSKGAKEFGSTMCVKHFVGNETEWNRFSSNSIIDERTLREVYLKPFELVIKEKAVNLLMGSYNFTNNVPMTANTTLVNDILRDEFGYDQAIVSDWNGVPLQSLFFGKFNVSLMDFVIYFMFKNLQGFLNVRVIPSFVKDILQATDIEMPGSTAYGKSLIDAVNNNQIDEATEVDPVIANILRLRMNTDSYGVNKIKNYVDWSNAPTERQKDTNLMLELARDGLMLLKNTDSILPLPKTSLTGANITIIGNNAENFLTAGGFSASIFKRADISLPVEAFQDFADSKGALLEYEPAFYLPSTNPKTPWFNQVPFDSSQTYVKSYFLNNASTEWPNYLTAMQEYSAAQTDLANAIAFTGTSTGAYWQSQYDAAIAARDAAIAAISNTHPLEGTGPADKLIFGGVMGGVLGTFSQLSVDVDRGVRVDYDNLPAPLAALNNINPATGKYLPIDSRDHLAQILAQNGHGSITYGKFTAPETGTYKFRLATSCNTTIYITECTGAPQEQNFSSPAIYDRIMGYYDITNSPYTSELSAWFYGPYEDVNVSLAGGKDYAVKFESVIPKEYDSLLESQYSYLGAYILGFAYPQNGYCMPYNCLLTYLKPSNLVAPATGVAAAAAKAAASDYPILFLGSPFYVSSEGNDRCIIANQSDPNGFIIDDDQFYLESVAVPTGAAYKSWQDELAKQVCLANPNTVVVINSRVPYDIEYWQSYAKAIIWAPGLGQESGKAIVDAIFGNYSPSAKLPVTWPKSVWDYSSTCFSGAYALRTSNTDVTTIGGVLSGPQSIIPGVNTVYYKEGIYQGHRWFDKNNIEPRFAFGHGLSYTTFNWSNATGYVSGDNIVISVNITNTGSMTGAEVVQVYLRDTVNNPRDIDTTSAGGFVQYIPTGSYTGMPIRQLRDFGKVKLAPGATQTLTISFPIDYVNYWDISSQQYTHASGVYHFDLAKSSRNIVTTVSVAL